MAKRYTIHPHNSGGYAMKPTSETTDDVVVLYQDIEPELAEAREWKRVADEMQADYGAMEHKLDQLRAKLRRWSVVLMKARDTLEVGLYADTVRDTIAAIDIALSDTPPTDERDQLLRRADELLRAWISDENDNIGLEDHDGEFCRCDTCERGREWLIDYHRLTGEEDTDE